jgi:hypothetical protein
MASSLTTDRRFAISIPRTNSLQSFFFFSVQSCAVAILAVGVSRCQRALLSVAIYGFFRVI